MKVTEEGLALIRESEGFRATAYRDVVGVWTIGFGHTSAAGPPQVAAGLAVTRAEAEKILARDVQNFAAALQPLIRAPLSDAQFSALVSFAYNVGWAPSPVPACSRLSTAKTLPPCRAVLANG